MQVAGTSIPEGQMAQYGDQRAPPSNVTGNMTVGGRSSKFFGCALCNKFRPSKRSYNAERHIWVKHISQTVVEGLSDSDPRPPYNAAKHKALVYRHQKKFFNIQPDIEPNLVAQRSFSQADGTGGERATSATEFKQSDQPVWALATHDQQAQATAQEGWNGYYDQSDVHKEPLSSRSDPAGQYSFSNWDPVYGQRRDGDGFAQDPQFQSKNKAYAQPTSPRYQSIAQRDYTGWPSEPQGGDYDQWGQQPAYLMHQNSGALSQGPHTLQTSQPPGSYSQQSYGGQALQTQHSQYAYGVQQQGPPGGHQAPSSQYAYGQQQFPLTNRNGLHQLYESRNPRS
eukprot:CFRG5280T1